VIVPKLVNFRIGRSSANTAQQLVSLANYARTQAVAEGRTYRMNFDANAGQFWLTAADDSGVYQPAPGDYGQKTAVADGAKMSVTVDPTPNVQMTLPATVQQQAITPAPPVADPNATSSQSNTLMANQRDAKDGTYVEFEPSGRCDVAIVTLTDRLRDVIRIGCPSDTESYHVLAPGEMSQ
jgi:Tfp pilus assembly protein FimT